MLRATVAILNFNGRTHLERYLSSVLENTPSELADILIIDNGSTDNSLEYLEHAPFRSRIKIIALPKNIGFASGYNVGLKNVHTEFYILLNSDVRVTHGWIEELLKTMDRDERIAVCQPKILSDMNTQYFDYSGALGGWIDYLGVPLAIGRIFKECEKDEGQYETPMKLAWACGAALMIRSTAYKEVNGMDDFFFAHQEEIDMCWRLSLKSYDIYNCPKSVVYHLGGGTLANDSSYKLFLNIRNNLIMLYKNLPFLAFLRIVSMRFFIDHAFMVTKLINLRPAQAWSIIKGYCAFLNWLLCVKKNKSVFSHCKGFPINGYYNKSVVVDYYLKGVRTFQKLRR